VGACYRMGLMADLTSLMSLISPMGLIRCSVRSTALKKQIISSLLAPGLAALFFPLVSSRITPSPLPRPTFSLQVVGVLTSYRR
jgi:hypothetical protein